MLNETYKAILLSKGYVYDEEEKLFCKEGIFYEASSNGVCSYLKIKEGKEFSEVEFEFLNPREIKEYEKALELISDFQEKEYGESSTYSRLVSIPLAYTTVGEDEETEISVYCNLLEHTITTYYGGVEVEKTEYPSLKAMNSFALSNLDFDSLVFVDEEWEEKSRDKKRPYIKDHSEKLNLLESIQLLKGMVKVGLLENDYYSDKEEMGEQNPEERLIVYRQSRLGYPEGWYSEDFLTVAQELCFDYESQQELWETLKDKDYEPVFNAD